MNDNNQPHNNEEGEARMDQSSITDEVTMEEILKENESPERKSADASGEIVPARIAQFTDDGVMVDVGMKAEGIIAKSEFKQDYFSQLKVGDCIPVYLESTRLREGHPHVSYRKAVEISAWKKIISAFNDKIPLEGKITNRIKGGFLIDVGIEAFIPASQMDIKPIKRPEEWIDRTVQVMITEYDRRKNNVVVSRRIIEEERYKQNRTKLLATVKAGDVVKGTVTGITKFGVFVDIGGVEGLLHIGNFSWYRIDRLEDHVHAGDTIDVKILSIEQNGEKISLGKKQIEPHPWDGVDLKFKPGTLVEGKISSITNFGVFVELTDGVEGLLHASEISWKDKNADPKKYFSVGQQLKLHILAVDRSSEKIGLSYKRTQENPWEKAKQLYAPGTRVQGTVTHLTPFGAFVMLPVEVEGLLHISDMSWTRRIKHPQEMVKVKQHIEAVVLEVTPEEEKISLGLKQLTQDPYEKYKVGTHVAGRVKRLLDFGAVVELESGIEAFIHISEMLPKSAPPMHAAKVRLNHPSEALDVGSTIEAKVIKIDRIERKIDLSIKKYERDMDQREIKKYMNVKNPLTLGELLEQDDEN